jgi:hypothetical protein
MLAVQEAVKNASTEAQVLRQLSAFAEDLHHCCVDSILPQKFSGLSTRNGAEVKAWAQKLSQEVTNDCSLGAAGRYWIDELREVFVVAAKRLDDISATRQQPASGVVPDTTRQRIQRAL